VAVQQGAQRAVVQEVARPAVARPFPVIVPAVTRSAPAAVRRPLGSVLLLAALTTVALTLVVLVPLGGWAYYQTPLALRVLNPAHPLLRPSGTVGRALGIAGTLLMLAMQLYSVRKRTRLLGSLGTVPHWLEFHIFCGVLGPALITLHTSFKFNGIVSVAYWSMVLVTLSGFVGRYLYVRIPKTLRGQELSHDEVVERADDLRARLLDTTLPIAMLRRVEGFENEVIPAAESATTWGGLLLGEIALRRKLAALRRDLREVGLDQHVLHEAAALIAERAVLLRRIAYLRKTKQMFDLWHVFHRPLATVMLVIVTLHIATALYLGYAFGAR